MPPRLSRLVPVLTSLIATAALAAPPAPSALTTARTPPLCCGRGGPLMGQRPGIPLEQRASPWSGDLLLAFEGDRPVVHLEALGRTASVVPGVQRVEPDPTGRFLRIWLDPSAAPATPARLTAALAAEGAMAVPAVLTPLRFDQAGEKGRIAAVEGALRRAPDIVTFEVEVEGEEAVARIWHRPGADLERLVTVLATVGIHAWQPTSAPADAPAGT